MKYKLISLIQQFAFWLLHKTVTESGYIKHFKNEIKLCGWTDENGNIEDDMQQLACSNVMDLLTVLSTQGHSGASYHYVVGLFTRASEFKPLSCLTGEPSEWNEVSGNSYQNKRYGSVFKDHIDGKAYWIDGFIFEDPEGSRFTNKHSREYINFPWYPKKPKIIHVTYDEDGNTVYPSDFIKQTD